MIEIGLCSDNGYAMATGVCVTSIFESNKNNKIRVHILTNGFSEENVRRFEQTAKNYNQIIEIHNIDASSINGLHVKSKGHVTSMAYARLQFPQLLDKSIEKLLYLDGDMVVIDDIKELWEKELNNHACLAVPDLIADDIVTHNRIGVYDIVYVNSGMLIINLQKWRSDNLTEKCIEFIKGYAKDNPFHDQDAINGIMGNDIGLLHFKYNFMVTALFKDRSKIQMHKKRWAALDEAQESHIIIHYTAPIKPWHKEFNHPIKIHFVETLQKSAWSDYKIMNKYIGLNSLKYKILKKLIDLKVKYNL